MSKHRWLFTFFFPLSLPRPALLCAIVVPSRPGGTSLSPFSQVRQKKSRIKKGQRKVSYMLRVGTARPPLLPRLGPLHPRDATLSLPSPPTPPPGALEPPFSRTHTPRKKSRTAEVTRSSWRSSLTAGTRRALTGSPSLHSPSPRVWGTHPCAASGAPERLENPRPFSAL